MKPLQAVLCGLGGQGIVFATKLLAHAARLEGAEVICSEFKGMAQRRASVVSFLKIGDFASASVRRGGADVVICLDASELDQALSYARPGGVCVVNASADDPDVWNRSGPAGVSIRRVDGGTGRSSNLFVLGAAGLMEPETLRRALSEVSPSGALGENLEAFDRGLEAAAGFDGRRDGPGK